MNQYNQINESISSFIIENKEQKRKSKEDNRQSDIDYEKRSLKFKEKETDVAKEKVEVLKEKETFILKEKDKLENPVNVNFTGNEDLVADRFVFLKEAIANLEIQIALKRVNTITKSQLVVLEFTATVTFIFILSRLAVENIDLLKMFVLVSTFQDIYGYSDMAFYADMVVQDYGIMLSSSYFLAVIFMENEDFYTSDTKIKMFYAFCVFAIGLLISSLLFSY